MSSSTIYPQLDLDFPPNFEIAIAFHKSCQERKMATLRYQPKIEDGGKQVFDFVKSLSEDPIYAGPGAILLKCGEFLPSEKLFRLLVEQCLEADAAMDKVEKIWENEPDMEYTFYEIWNLGEEYFPLGYLVGCLEYPRDWENNKITLAAFRERRQMKKTLTELLLTCVNYVYPEKFRFIWQNTSHLVQPAKLLLTPKSKIVLNRALVNIQGRITKKEQCREYDMGQSCGPDSGLWRSDNYNDHVEMRDTIVNLLANHDGGDE